MINLDNRLFCRLDGLTVSAREQQRLSAMAELGLLESESIPMFEEATQTAAHFLDAPICLLGLMDEEQQRFKSAVGLSRLGLMNELATTRRLLRPESFCTFVVDSHQALVISDTLAHPAFAHSVLTQQYGIRAYLGVPLMTSQGFCLGTLAVMDLKPRTFTVKEIDFLELTARWSMSEFERRHLAGRQSMIAPIVNDQAPADSAHSPKHSLDRADGTPLALSLASQLKVELLGQLTQELRTPLTSVMGMASVLIREIYGPLTDKQKEYLGIIHHSGQYLLSLVNEILELSHIKDHSQGLNLTSVDVEMLCQQAINTLEQAARRREQQIRLTVEPGRRIWLLDKDKVRQLLYHLVFSVIQSSNAGSIVCLHVSYKGSNLTFTVWVSHPWLDEGLPYAEVYAPASRLSIAASTSDTDSYNGYLMPEPDTKATTAVTLSTAPRSEPGSLVEFTHSGPGEAVPVAPQRNLGLLLSRQLAEMHGGRLVIHGRPESGLRYVVSLPQPSETAISQSEKA